MAPWCAFTDSRKDATDASNLSSADVVELKSLATAFVRSDTDRAAVRYAEAFEACEYGSPLSGENVPRLFPFFGQALSGTVG